VRQRWKITSGFVAALVAAAVLTGCGLMGPAKKPDIGPAGKPTEAKPNPPVMERFASAPTQLYDLEAIAGTVFEGVNKENWQQAEAGLYNLQAVWQQTKEAVGDKKGVKDGDEAIGKLATSVMDRKITASYENLNKFMGSAADIGKSYKLSPVADLIAVGNALRSVSFYVVDKNWSKSASKVKGLEDTWNHAKPALEQVGVLGAVTTSHAYVKQLKDAVNAESEGAAEEQVANLNESLGKIREYYRGK
jgi:cobalamin biosynthesis Mg chelatase CobN/predicted small lipoprotein YifL